MPAHDQGLVFMKNRFDDWRMGKTPEDFPFGADSDLQSVLPYTIARDFGWNLPLPNAKDRLAFDGEVSFLRNHPDSPRKIHDVEVLICAELENCLIAFCQNEWYDEHQKKQWLQFVSSAYPIIRAIRERYLDPAGVALFGYLREWKVAVEACRLCKARGLPLSDDDITRCEGMGDQFIALVEEWFEAISRGMHPAGGPIRFAAVMLFSMIRRSVPPPSVRTGRQNADEPGWKYSEPVRMAVDPVFKILDDIIENNSIGYDDAVLAVGSVEKLLGVLKKTRAPDRKDAVEFVAQLLGWMKQQPELFIDYYLPAYRSPDFGLIDWTETGESVGTPPRRKRKSFKEEQADIPLPVFQIHRFYSQAEIETGHPSAPSDNRKTTIDALGDQLPAIAKAMQQTAAASRAMVKELKKNNVLSQSSLDVQRQIESHTSVSADADELRLHPPTSRVDHTTRPDMLDCVREYEPNESITFNLSNGKTRTLHFHKTKEWEVVIWAVHLSPGVFDYPPFDNPKSPFTSDKKDTQDARAFADLLIPEADGRKGTKQYRLSPERIPTVLG